MKMKTICKHMVKPADITRNGFFPLTELDHVSPTHTFIAYFYDRPIQSTNKIIDIDTLKDSLSRVLVPFYPLAGRLYWVGGGRVKLECNAMGAELIELESTMKIADFGDYYTSSDKFYDLLPEIDYCGKPIDELPLLSVQVTRFACGGVSLGFSVSHVIIDGRSIFHFIKEWARLTRGEPLKVAPFLDRRVLLGEVVGDPSSTTKEVEDGGSMEYFRKVGLGKLGDNVTPIFELLTKERIISLKQEANNSNESDNIGQLYSSFQAMTAYVWRLVCEARGLKGGDVATLVVVVDARRRMVPPLPLSYFGNGIIDIQVSSCAGELMSRPLSYACSKVREAIRKAEDNKFVLEKIEFLKSQQSLINYQFFEDRGKHYSPPSSSGAYSDVVVISWLKIGCTGVDFGWGMETYMGPPMVHGTEGTCFITPYNKNDGSVVIGTFLQQPKSPIQNKYNATRGINNKISTLLAPQSAPLRSWHEKPYPKTSKLLEKTNFLSTRNDQKIRPNLTTNMAHKFCPIMTLPKAPTLCTALYAIF